MVFAGWRGGCAVAAVAIVVVGRRQGGEGGREVRRGVGGG